MNSTLAPIVLFCYNRPKHTELTLTALSENTLADQSELFVFCDGPKLDATAEQLNKIEQVRGFVKSKNWCGKVTVFESPSNKGLANSVIDGVTKIVNEFGRVIVLEDDLVTSKGFLKYMNTALEKYKEDEEVMQISGHQFPVEKWERNNEAFFLPFTTSWGWATWKRAWNYFDEAAIGYEELKGNQGLRSRFNLDNSYDYAAMLITQMESTKISSWAIRWWWSVFSENGLVLYPDKSLIKNIGWDGSGRHSGKTDPFYDPNWNADYILKKFPIKIESDKGKYDLLKEYLSKPGKSVKISFFYRIFKRLKNRIDR